MSLWIAEVPRDDPHAEEIGLLARQLQLQLPNRIRRIERILNYIYCNRNDNYNCN
jgi:hypothetical protein